MPDVGLVARGLRWGLALLTAAVTGALAQTQVEVTSLDSHAGKPLPAYWFQAEGNGSPRPAVVLLHGCGGLYDTKGRLGVRFKEYAQLLNDQGWHVVVPDSLTPRGERELCTQRIGERRTTQFNRRLDALATLQWLATQPGVDGRRLGLLGWSHGGSTVLAATNRLHRDVAHGAVRPRVAVAFYPGCKFELEHHYAATAPTLLLLGEKDDWTPAQPCVELAAGPSSGLNAVVYPDAYHGFDGRAALRVRTDVPNGTRPGQGVTVGANPAAREASRQDLLAFLQQHLR